MVAGATDEGVCLLEFTDRRMLEAQLETLGAASRRRSCPARIRTSTQLRSELGEYFAGTRRDVHRAARRAGHAVRGARVAARCSTIPTARRAPTRTSRGRSAARRPCARWARANGLNRIAIVIPCHRVVNKSGELGGYGGGLWRKRRLLELEQGQRIEGLLSESA